MIVAFLPGDTELAAEKSQKKPAIEWMAVHQAEQPLETTVDPELLYLEDMNVGDRWLSAWREITGMDVADFAALTGDNDPLHSDDFLDSPFGEPVAHGLLGLSVLAGLSSEKPSAATLALISISEWHFEAPIYFGDRVRVMTEIVEIQRHGRRAGRVTWHRQLLNQHGRIVQRGQFVSLVSTRARARRLSNQEHTQRGSVPAR